MQRGPFAGFHLVSVLPSLSGGPERWAARHSDGRQAEVLLGDQALLDSASRLPQGGPWGVVLTGKDEVGPWVLVPGELLVSLAQLRGKISARAAFVVGHLILEALDAVHDAGEFHGRLAPEHIGFDANGGLQVRARPDVPLLSDVDDSAQPQDTDCWAVGGLIHFLLGGDWPPAEGAQLPDFDGMDPSRAKLAISGLLRRNPRLRLKPARFARQAVGAALQEIEEAEADLLGQLAVLGCGGELRNAAPVLPTGLDSAANQSLVEAFTQAVVPTARIEPLRESTSPVAPETVQSPVQIELQLPTSASPSETDDETGEEAEPVVVSEEAPEELGEEPSSLEAPVEAPSADEDEDGVVESPLDETREPPAETPSEEETDEEPVQEEIEESTAEEAALEEAVDTELLAEESQSPIRVQIGLPPSEFEPAAPVDETGSVSKQPLELEPFRMPLPEAVPAAESEPVLVQQAVAEESTETAEVEPQDADKSDQEHSEEPVLEQAEAVRIQMPLPEAAAPAVLEPEPAVLDPTPIPIPQPDLPAEAFEEDILSEEELDALLAGPIDDDRLEPTEQEALEEDVVSPGVSPEELVALEEEADWGLNVEVGTRSDLDEDLGPGKWVESGRSPEELARELDSMPVVDREFDLNPKSAALPRLLAVAALLALVLLGFSLMGSGNELVEEAPSARSISLAAVPEQPVEDLPRVTVTTNLELARVTLDGVEYGRAPASIPLPQDEEQHRLCVEYGSAGRCVNLSAEELAARDPYQIAVE